MPDILSLDTLGVLFPAHPWHGVEIGDAAPDVVTCYIEIVPTDVVKYELDKRTGLLRVDRPQKYSNICPCLYGLVPRTLCGPAVAERALAASQASELVGDDDPLDICVLTERAINHGNILVEAVPIGGFRMLDGNEADDKIVAVLAGDAVYGSFTDISQCPQTLVERLQHYFLTYKQAPNTSTATCRIVEIYGRAEAHEVIRASIKDYEQIFAGLRDVVALALGSNH